MENLSEEYGVLSKKIENNHYVLSIKWRDGKQCERIFPVNGFTIIDVETGDKLGFLNGEKAVEILVNNSANYNEDEFHWKNFI